MLIYLKFICFLYFVSLCSSEDLPSFIHVCHKDDQNLEQCMTAAIEDLRPYLVSGVEEYNIPSIEPLVMHDLISEDIAGLSITTSNVSAWGCSEYFVRHIEMDLDTNDVVVDIYIPKLRIEAHYKVDGKLLLLPVKGNGNLETNVTEVSAHLLLKGETYEKDGDLHLRYTSNDMTVTLGGGNVRLENLFNGDKVLLGIMNDVVNRNFDSFMKEMLPVISRALSSTFLVIGNNIVERFTYEQLFPN